jgi:hypothetical protein
VQNVDGTPNKAGMLTHYLHLHVQLGEKEELMMFYITNLREDRTLLGFPWFAAFNPDINWTEGTMNNLPIHIYSPTAAKQTLTPATTRGGKGHRSSFAHEEEEQIFMAIIPPEIIGKTTIATDLAAEQAVGKEKKDWSELIPQPYHHHEKIFSEKEAKRLPPHHIWDHVIALTPDAPKTLDCKTYPLTLKEQDAVDILLEEQVEKGYIKPSDSPYASQIFFVKKKDGSFHPVQDFCHLNKYTIPDHFPLPNLEDMT